jgi:very-short-patch-repair endonuclease
MNSINVSSPLMKGGIKRGVGMPSAFNKLQSKAKRKYLRKNLTESEKLLWKKLRNRQLNGLRFRRQYGVLNYVVDFYCPEYKLALEIIGDVHGYSARKRFDLGRAKDLQALGIKILSFTNLQVQDEIDGVLDHILSNLPPAPSFIRRGSRRTTRNNE